MTYVTGITPERAIVLYALRVNPDKVERIEGALKNTYGAMCAAGLACDVLGIETATNSNAFAAFYLSSKLKMSETDVTTIFSLNDSYHLDFAEIADLLEEFFTQNPEEFVSLISVYRNRRK